MQTKTPSYQRKIGTFFESYSVTSAIFAVSGRGGVHIFVTDTFYTRNITANTESNAIKSRKDM